MFGHGRTLYQGSAQAPNLYVVLVGDSSTGRKGTAGSVVREIFGAAYPGWEAILVPGLGSGEGLIGHLSREAERAKLTSVGADRRRDSRPDERPPGRRGEGCAPRRTPRGGLPTLAAESLDPAKVAVNPTEIRRLFVGREDVQARVQPGGQSPEQVMHAGRIR